MNKIEKISDETYYKYMTTKLRKQKGYKAIRDMWLLCFAYILRQYQVGHNDKTISSLFYEFEMDNWRALHQDSTEFKGASRKKLLNCFFGECSYICDRATYDRLFRTHWLFRRAFNKELYTEGFDE